MTMNSRDQKDFGAAKTREFSDRDSAKSNFPSNIASSSSRQWSSISFKNPRIVRASRNFGGKDRHSKVCTVRGLRDRRIRLSIPTALQLYDLQDRLGLSQPSKVVDWLIDATKHEIDRLPPLPMIPLTNFAQSHHHQPTYESSSLSLSDFLTPNKMMNERENEEGFGAHQQISAQNFFPVSSSGAQFCVPNNLAYNSSNYFHWDHQNLALSQFGGGYPFSAQTEEQSYCSLSSTLSSTCDQLYTRSSYVTTPFPSYNIPTNMENVQQTSSLLPTTLHLISSPAMKSLSLSKDGKWEEDKRS